MPWQIAAASARGASHVRSGRPNQDAMAWSFVDDNTVLAVAVADGHGSSKCFRSDAGAKLAVKLATQILAQSAAPRMTDGSAAAIDAATTKLPEALVCAWRNAICDALEKEPFTPAELDALEAEDGAGARRIVEQNPLVAYGATLLGILLTPSFIFYLQLGDGDILTISDDGEVMRPVPGDDRLFANETTSLCQSDAWRAMRTKLQSPIDNIPALILLSTDGYANSFGDDPAFLKVGSDLLSIARSEGLDIVRQELPAWLAQTSNGGSGDDITLAIICRSDVCASASVAIAEPSGVSCGSKDGLR